MPVRSLTALLFVLLLARPACANDALALKRAGHAAFSEGKKLVDAGKDGRPAFLRAWLCFYDSADDGIGTPGQWLNIGNAAYLADDLPAALVWFRGGLMHDPHHPTLRANLAFARAQVQYPAGKRGRPEPDFWPAWLPRLSSGTLLTFAVLGYALGCVMGACWRLQRRSWILGTALVCFVTAGGAVWGYNLLHIQQQRDRGFPVAVILYDDVTLHTGNGSSFPRNPELPTLRRGMEARQLHKRGDWLQIQFATGEIGWISSHSAFVISW